jgi:molybdate transport system substrate-binding protein
MEASELGIPDASRRCATRRRSWMPCRSSAIAGLMLMLGAMILMSCSKETGSIYVHAGAGIAPPLDVIGEMFAEEHGIRVEYNYGGSGHLLTNIAVSRKGDLYMPGELWYMEQAIERGLVEDYTVVAHFVTVIVVQKGNPKGVQSVFDLTREDLRVGIADPEAAAIGVSQQRVLAKAGIYEEVSANAQTHAICVPELANHVKLGHLDATIVWNATAALYPDDLDMIPIPEDLRDVTDLPLGILTFSEKQDAAKVYQDFVSSEKGRQVFKNRGYSINRAEIDEDLRQLKLKLEGSD